MSGALGCLTPTNNYEHVSRYPLRDLETAGFLPPTHVPVIFGVNWHTSFDDPITDSQGNFWIGRGGFLGSVRGRHCITAEPVADKSRQGQEQDTATFYRWYNQAREGACTGFGTSRAMSLINRHRYDAWFAYDEARRLEGRYPDGEGAEVRSALEVWRLEGGRIPLPPAPRVNTRGEVDRPSSLGEGIKAYRWATKVDEILAALGTPNLDYIVWLNSWGSEYPQRVHIPATAVDQLLREGGEAAVVTDR